jgi:hypothetical protein
VTQEGPAQRGIETSLGLVRRAAADKVEPLLHAVDREIDARGEPL